MKKIAFLFCFVFAANWCLSQNALVNFNNTTMVYYVGTFFTIPISGNCPSTALTTFYHDISDQRNFTDYVYDETGSFIPDIADVSGITIQKASGGTPYVIPFCLFGIPSSAGFTSIPEPNGSGNPFTIVTWNINTGTNTVLFSLF